MASAARPNRERFSACCTGTAERSFPPGETPEQPGREQGVGKRGRHRAPCQPAHGATASISGAQLQHLQAALHDSTCPARPQSNGYLEALKRCIRDQAISRLLRDCAPAVACQATHNLEAECRVAQAAYALAPMDPAPAPAPAPSPVPGLAGHAPGPEVLTGFRPCPGPGPDPGSALGSRRHSRPASWYGVGRLASSTLGLWAWQAPVPQLRHERGMGASDSYSCSA